ncbi:MAG: glycoside hydrolase family 3 N-terminal domain-containing protein [Bacteroidota bacterium]|nr:hypothetical protein [Candidatus Kapabacteria bacterium]MDW8075620.1 glycoside hydrolase family 3 N-terminal domain-containing protein [Bacteroidota bacterium]
MSIARRILARLHPSRYVRDGEYRDLQLQLVQRGIGGFCIMDGTLESVAETIAALRAEAHSPLLFAIDGETGLRMRIEDAAEFPHAWALGLQSPAVTEEVSAAIARSLRSLGIAWNFAPVADVASNPHNPIIGIRAFGAQPATVVEHVQAWIRAHQREKVAACAKHFPGHGDATVDSHVELPVINVPLEVLVERELVPFYAAIKEDIASIMVGHLAVPAMDASGKAASLSPAIMRDFLRQRLGYGGIIVTDALDMQPIRQRYSSGEAVVEALAAGADVALLPADAHEALTIAEAAFRRGVLSQEEHHAAIARLDRLAAMAQENVPVSVRQEELANTALWAAQGAIRYGGNTAVLPLSQYAHIVVFALVQDGSPLDGPTEFLRYVAELYRGNMDAAFISPSVSAEEMAAFSDAIAEAECIVVAVFERPQAARLPVPYPEHVVATLAQRGTKPLVLVLAGSPWQDVGIAADTVLWTFSDSSPSCAAAAVALTKPPEW